MKTKKLQADDKLLFVRFLYDYCSRPTNAKVKAEYASKLGVSERSFADKMVLHRAFKGQELDTAESLYRDELGQAEYDRLFSLFLSRAADGDRRTIEAAQDGAIARLTELNSDLATSKLLV